MKTNSFLFTAGIVLAMAFTFSCSSDDGEKETGGGQSSPSGELSSSDGGGNGGTLYTCQLATGCIQATISNCSQVGGEIVAVCQEQGSSSSNGETLSSSSNNEETLSSSSITPSSSSEASVSSSSSATPSSSSEVSVSSSSSAILSSSSEALSSSNSFDRAQKAQPVAASNNLNEPKVLKSWRNGNVNWYVIDVGHIDASLIMKTDPINYQGKATIAVSMSETVEESMSNSRTATVSNSVTFFESSTVSKNINDFFDAKAGGKAGWGPFSVEGSVQKTITENYGVEVKVETTQGRTTETSQTVIDGLKTARTNTLTYSIGVRNDPAGCYRYAWYTTNDVYFVISTSSDNQELLSWNTISAPRTGTIQALEYSEKSCFDKDVFDNSPAKGSEIVFAEDFYKRLPPPESKACGSNSYYDNEAFCDTRDNKVYKFVEIGTQTWMAENLNYNASGSACYDNLESNCNKYGRLYDWETAMKACPSGWYVPGIMDWDKLFGYVDDLISTPDFYESPTAGKDLKATSGWNGNGNGTNKFGFAALPGGLRRLDGSFYNAGNYGNWWSAPEYDNGAYNRNMNYNSDVAGWHYYDKNYFFSVRCVKL